MHKRSIVYNIYIYKYFMQTEAAQHQTLASKGAEVNLWSQSVGKTMWKLS